MELKTPQTLVITSVRDQARATRSFDLRVDKAVNFTPGQVAVFYDGARVLGGARITRARGEAPEDTRPGAVVTSEA